MESEIIERFDLGLISEYDVDSSKLKPNALKDCLNVEINDPLFAIERTKGWKSTYDVPLYSGAENVAIKRFSVDSPSSQELMCLVRKSNNLLYYSENFSIKDLAAHGWTLTLDGATLKYGEGDGPVRVCSKFTGATSNTKIEQTVTVIPGVYIFSLYVVGVPANYVRIEIVEGGSSSYLTIADDLTGVGQGFLRYQVARSVASTSITVRISILQTTNALKIWGAQLEEATYVTDTAVGYGYTHDYTLPYYIYVRPYWDGSDWVDDWRELTERRAFNSAAGVIDPYIGAENTTNLWNTSEATTYFDAWFVYEAYTQNSLILRNKFGPYTFNIYGNNGIDLASSRRVIIARYPDADKELSQNNTNSDKVFFLDNANSLVISFDSDELIYPVMISYVNKTPFSGTSYPVDFDGLMLTRESLSPPATANTQYYYNSGVMIHSVTDVSGSGTFTTSPQTVMIVGTLNNKSKVLLDWKTVADTPPWDIEVVLKIDMGKWNPRLTSIEYYVCSGSTPDTAMAYFIQEIDVEDLLVGMSIGSTYKYVPKHTLQFDNAQPTLFANIQRDATVKSRTPYKYQTFINGKKYVSGFSSNGDLVRQSSIRDVVEEIAIFPHDEVSNYGEIIANSGSAERITGLAKTITNDLVIFKDRSTLIYEVQSSRAGVHRLYAAFNGTGCVNDRGVAYNTDFGIFWFDDKGIYNYVSGIGQPTDISLGSIKTWWRDYLSQYSSNAFAIFNRKLNEYWIFIQVTGTLGDTHDAYYKVLRYSPIHKNWNLMQFSLHPSSVTDKIDGTVEMCDKTNIFECMSDDGDATDMVSPMIHTHAITFKNPFVLKEVFELAAKYSGTAQWYLDLYVNGEYNPRSGNSILFKSSVTSAKHQTRHSTKGNTFNLKLYSNGSGTLKISFIAAIFSYIKNRWSSVI